MFKWLKDKLRIVFEWIQLRIANIGKWLQLFLSSNRSPIHLSEVDFSSYNVGDQRFQSESYAKMYEMTSSRKWQWLRNLIYLKKWSQPTKNENNNTHILEQFSNREEILAHTDLSFAKNPLPLSPVESVKCCKFEMTY